MKVDDSKSKNSRMWFDVLSKQLNKKEIHLRKKDERCDRSSSIQDPFSNAFVRRNKRANV
jgi:hypothetical protein